jgi:hypothetical protein
VDETVDSAERDREVLVADRDPEGVVTPVDVTDEYR